MEAGAVGLGCMGMSHAYGAPADRQEMLDLVAFAVDNGVTLFDTAEVYGMPEEPHHNETRIGEALKSYRQQVRISTKSGLRFDYDSPQWNKPVIADSSPEAIRRSVEGSLKRLQTDHIDIYFQHRVDPAVEPESVAQVMADLMREGKILHWGVSESPEGYIRRAHAAVHRGRGGLENGFQLFLRHGIAGQAGIFRFEQAILPGISTPPSPKPAKGSRRN